MCETYTKIVDDSKSLRIFIQRWADDEFVNGHLLSTGLGYWGAGLEENIACGSISQDDLGHAKMLYLTFLDSDEALDHEVFGRAFSQFESHGLACAWQRDDWAFVVVKELLYSEVDGLRLQRFRQVVDGINGEWSFLVPVSVEDEMHRKYWREWLMLLSGNSESALRLQTAWESLYPYALSMVEELAAELDIPVATLKADFHRILDEVRQTSHLRAFLTLEAVPLTHLLVHHHETISDIIEEMQFVYRTAPSGTWG